MSAGYQVAKDALGGALSSEHLTIGGRKWKLRRGKDSNEGDMLLPTTCCTHCQPPKELSVHCYRFRAGPITARAQLDLKVCLLSARANLTISGLSCAGGKKAKGGRTADLKGANVVVTAYVNGEPRTQLELLEGFQKIPFGAGVPCNPNPVPSRILAPLVLYDISEEAHVPDLATCHIEVLLLHRV